MSRMQRMKRRRARPVWKPRQQRELSPRLLAMTEHQSRQHLGRAPPRHMQMAILKPQVRPVYAHELRLAIYAYPEMYGVWPLSDGPVLLAIPCEDSVAAVLPMRRLLRPIKWLTDCVDLIGKLATSAIPSPA